MADEPIPELRPFVVEGSKAVAGIIVAARSKVLDKINSTFAGSSIHRLSSQLNLYKVLGSIYEKVDDEIEGWAKKHTKKIVDRFEDIALDDLGGGSGLVRYDKGYVQDVFQRIHPSNSEKIAAVYTKKMLRSDVEQLRGIALETTRLSAVAGLTQKQQVIEMRNRWDDLKKTGGLKSYSFISKDGKKWDNGNYFSMLVRTTSGRIHRDTYLDTLASNGRDLARINNSGGATSCPSCQAFDGVIISISGDNKNFPSEAQARLGGVFHPNCLCYYSVIDTDRSRDEKDVEDQSGLPNPDTDDKQEWLAYARRFQESKKVDVDKAPTGLRNPSEKQKRASQRDAQERRESDEG